MMHALVHHGPGHTAWEEVGTPELLDDTDAIVRADRTTICGTDLHILEGDLPAVIDGRILGHEAVGTAEADGAGVKNIKPGALDVLLNRRCDTQAECRAGGSDG